jgi:hypothetical protein
MSSKFRLISVLTVATLMVVAGCSIIAFRANAQTQYRVLLRQRHQTGACVDIGTITVDRTPYVLPATLMLSIGDHSLAAPLPSGCEFVMWEVEGGVSVKESNSWTLSVIGEGTVRLVNKGVCCGVGGVVAETNTFTVLTPYLVAVGLIATTAAVAVKKRRN